MTGKEFLHERKSLGWTQGNVAKVMGCSVRSVRRWEKGEVRVPQSLETIIALRRDLERWRVRADQYNDECERMGIKGQAIIDQLSAENKQLHHDLERQMSIANEHVSEVDTLLREIETLRVDALAERVHGYYIGFAKADEQNDPLREALADLLHAVCGQTGFAETVRRDSGRIYPWPALDLAEAKAIAALEQSK